MTFNRRHQSHVLLDGADRAAARSFFRAIGFGDEDLKKPLVGVAHCWIEITPCNWNHQKLAEKVKEGIRAAGGTPIEFNTISVTDGIAMGTEGMKASLVSREIVADSVELVVRGHLLDAFVGISGCDKTIPGMVMAMARLNIPSVMLYGGSIAYGEYKGKRLTIQDVFEAIGAFNADKIDAQELRTIEGLACPGAGACGGQFTANTMATAFEMLGVSPMGYNGVARRRSSQAGDRDGDRPPGHGYPPSGSPAASDHHTPLAAERDRRRDGHGRLDQRRAPPPGGGQGGGSEARYRRVRSGVPEDATARRHEALGQLTPPRRCTRPGGWASSPGGCSTPSY
jgi:hypothetical protein